MIPEIELEINTRETTGNSPNPRKPRPSRRPQARLFSEERHGDPSGNGLARPRTAWVVRRHTRVKGRHVGDPSPRETEGRT